MTSLRSPSVRARPAIGVLLLVALLLVAGAPRAFAAPARGITVAGVGSGLPATLADLDEAKALGARLVRVELPWRLIEPHAAGERDPGVLADLDATIAGARERGLKVVLVIDQTPCWTSTAPERLKRTCVEGYQSYPPANYRAFGAVAAFTAARYRSDLTALEVWNEPDQANERYWAGPRKAQRYAALLRTAYPMVKAAAPGVPVVGASVVGTNGRFLAALYAAGIKGSYDGISVHFYDLPLLGLRQTRAVQLRHGDRKPLWLLETGWNSCAPRKQGTEGQPCVTRARQGTDLRNLFGQVARASWIKAAVVYKVRDDAIDAFGVVDTSGARKPSFGSLRAAWSVTRPSVSGLALSLRPSGASMVVSGSGPDGDAYVLEVRQAGVLRYRATFRLDATGHFDLRLPRQLGTSRLRVTLRDSWSGRATSRRR